MESDAAPPGQAVYFDGRSNRKRAVALRLAAAVEIIEEGVLVDVWPYGEVRRADGPPDVLRLGCVTALPLARLELLDLDLHTKPVSPLYRVSRRRGENVPDREVGARGGS